MTEITPVDLNVILQNLRRSNLTKEQVFRLWRCAIKDDDTLVDQVIQHAYEGMIAFDCRHAECVMALIVRRHTAAGCELRTLLADMRGAPAVPYSACDPGVEPGFPPSRSPLRRAKEGSKRSCSRKMPEQQSIQSEAIAL